MSFIKFFGGALLAMSFASGPVSAMPSAEAPAAGDGLVVKVAGCHADVRYHYVPQFGQKAWHFHRQSNCRPVRANPVGSGDCHRNIRRHYLPQYGGNVTHKHVGPNCRVRVYDKYNPNKPKPGFCVQIGIVRYCEY